MEKKKIIDIDNYIKDFPEETQKILMKVRETIKQSAPGAEETISYQIPTFTLKGNIVHFAAYKNHIGFYPTSSGIKKFKEELSACKGAKGSVQFPIDKEIPYDLISRIVQFRVKENLERVETKKGKITKRQLTTNKEL